MKDLDKSLRLETRRVTAMFHYISGSAHQLRNTTVAALSDLSDSQQLEPARLPTDVVAMYPVALPESSTSVAFATPSPGLCHHQTLRSAPLQPATELGSRSARYQRVSLKTLPET
jgi:hypothetical protein